MQLTVITSTWQRPQQLLACLEQFRAQSAPGLASEHLVVSDGPDAVARQLCARSGVRLLERTETGGRYGAAAKDDGIQAARGEYVCFWDDDNRYAPHALATLYAAACGVDIGVVQAEHLLRRTGEVRIIPRRWTGQFRLGDVDTMCVCVRRELALKARWADGTQPYATDFDWLQRLAVNQPRVRYVPLVIGTHV